MKRSIVAIAVFAACACSSSAPVAFASPSTATASRITYPGASPSGSIGRYAVMQRGDDEVDLVSEARGNVVAVGTFSPAAFRPNQFMPTTSESATRLYFLTGGSGVEFLNPDGSGGPSTNIAMNANQQAGFAVSPDDRRIAVSILTYDTTATPAYVGMRMYVEDLTGGGHHVELFTSSSVAEYPIGWVGGNLVVAVSSAFCCPNPPSNPYAASAYHVVDPTTGRRLATLCGPTAPMGPVEPIGVMCRGSAGPPQFLQWNGSPFPAPAAVPDPGPYLAALSPDGTQVLLGGEPISILVGRNPDSHIDLNGYAAGWIDDGHFVVKSVPDNNYWVFGLNLGGYQVPGETAYLGTLPAAIS